MHERIEKYSTENMRKNEWGKLINIDKEVIKLKDIWNQKRGKY